MALSQYDYTKAVAVDRLTEEVTASEIVPALNHINFTAPDSVSLFFKAALSSAEEDVLDGIISNHSGEPLSEAQNVHIETIEDADAVPLFRLKMAAEGAKFCYHGIEFETSTLASVMEEKADGTSFGYSSIKLYDTNGTEITAEENETNCVTTVVSFEPTSKNYEIIGGTLYQGTPPTSEIRAWAVGVPTVPEQYGGSVHFLSSARCDLAPAGLAFRMDGRVPKYMRYHATNHTSRFDFTFKHDAGVKHKFAIMLELFWP